MGGLIPRKYLPCGPHQTIFLRYSLHAALFIKTPSHQARQTPHENLLILIYMRAVAEPEQSMHSELTLTATCIRRPDVQSLSTNIHNETRTCLWRGTGRHKRLLIIFRFTVSSSRLERHAGFSIPRSADRRLHHGITATPIE
jgi:hypothetical protein